MNRKRFTLLNTIIVIAFFLMTASCGQKGPLPAANTTPPTVTYNSPASGSTGVPINTSVAIIFSEAMISSTVNTTTINLSDQNSGAVHGTVSYTGATATALFTPASNLDQGALYTLTINGVTNTSGIAMANPFSSFFTTGSIASFSTITATAGTNGTISPSGAVLVAPNASQTFTITPSAGYSIAAVLVDGVPQGPVPTTYTFILVNIDHTISASFTQIITGSGGQGGP